MDKEQLSALIIHTSEENDQFKMVLNSLVEGVIVLKDDYTVSFVNTPTYRLIPMEQKLHGLVWDSIHDGDVCDFLYENLRQENKIKDKEFSISDERIGMKIITINGLPLVKQGRVVGTVIIITDITERRKREVKLHQAEHLASLTTLTAGVAHEVKNPLASMSIHVQLMQRKLAIKDVVQADEMEKHLSVIDEEVNRLNSIIVDFLFAVRPVDIKPTKQAINEIINDVLTFVRFELKEHGISVYRNLEEDMPEVVVDARYIKQSLLNIIKNAIAAMDKKNPILEIRTRKKNSVIMVVIKDNGVGIESEKIGTIFQPFYTTKSYGNGLGLTMVYKVIKDHGGDIAITSKKGKGTTITLSFPIEQSEQALITKEENGR